MIPDTIAKLSGSKIRVYLHSSKNEHTYQDYINFLIEDLHNQVYAVIMDIQEYDEYSKVAMYFPRFLVESAKKELKR